MSETRRRRWEFALVVLSGALWFGAGTEAIHGLLGHERWNWGEMVVRALPWALAVFGAQWVFRAVVLRPGERRARGELAHLRRTGTLPPHADPAQLRPFLEEERRRLGFGRRAVSVVWPPLAVLVGAAAVWANDNSPAVWALAMVVVLDGVAAQRFGRADVADVDRLLDQLPA